ATCPAQLHGKHDDGFAGVAQFGRHVEAQPHGCVRRKAL
ncbi:MAG: hypothetical protein AVDCRST_MAG56-7298, partial [uncultured Cytophagales bacterium]